MDSRQEMWKCDNACKVATKMGRQLVKIRRLVTEIRLAVGGAADKLVSLKLA